MKYFSIFLALLPSFIHVNIRRILGSKIGKGSRIKIGTIIIADKLTLGENVKIGPFSYIKAEEILVGDNSIIKSLSIISTRIIKFGKYVHIAPLAIIMSEFTENSKISIGDHSRIFPYCWLDTGEGITIGKQSGVGTHSFIYTHGVWSDYLNGAPINYGPVVISDNVWIPTRVSILPNVEIGKNTIIGANSIVNKSISENVFVAGTPAKVIKDYALISLSNEEKINRSRLILKRFSEYINFKFKIQSTVNGNILSFKNLKISIDDMNGLQKGDMLFLVNYNMSESELMMILDKGVSVLNHNIMHIKIVSKNEIYNELIPFVRRFGIRLYIDK